MRSIKHPEPFAHAQDRHFGLGGFKEITLSSSKLVMMYTERVWHPPTDVYETPEEIVIKTEIAGIAPEEIVVTVEENKLCLGGNRLDKTKHTRRSFKQMEINYGALERVILLSHPFQPDRIEAVYKDGFLEITIPKSREVIHTPPRKIKIKGN